MLDGSLKFHAYPAMVPLATDAVPVKVTFPVPQLFAFTKLKLAVGLGFTVITL